MTPDLQSRRASVVLLSLCFVAVLGISLASYLSLASRSMQIGNRAVKQGQAEQLSELGIEEGLRAINLNLFSGADINATLADWSSGDTSVNWTVDTANKRARATMSFPAGKFGTGITATVKIRIDNYDAGSLDSLWNSSTTYRMGNLVGYNGTWYRGISNDNNKTPNVVGSSVYWIQENNAISSGLTWTLGTTYAQGNMVLRNSQWYRYTSAGSSTASTTNAPGTGASWSTYWTAAPQLISNDEYTAVYDNQSILNYYNTWYWRSPSTDWWAANPTLTWRWRTSYSYVLGDVVCYNQVWYRCHTAHTSGTWSTTNWTNISSLTATAGSASWAWDSNTTYNIGDNVYHSGTTSWYRCRIANSNQTPSSASVYWANTPVLSQDWDATRRYSAGDVVYFNGLWYRCRTTGTFGSANNPITDTTNWYSSAVTAQQWSATTAYAVGDYRSYGGVWYRCLVANTGFSPNNTTYWTPTWTQGSGAITGSPVIYAEATVDFADGTSSITQYRAALGRNPLFPNALAATTTLALSGSSINVFSYESTTDPGAATEGYAAVLAAGTASASGTTGLLTISSTSTTIKGYLAAPAASTGYTPRVSYPANAVVQLPGGTVTSPAPSAINVDLTRISGSPYIPQFDIQSVPSYSSSTISNVDSAITLGTAGGATPQVVARTGNLTMDDSDDVLTIVGPVVLDVQGDLRITGDTGAKIVIAETGSLRLHVSGRLRLDSTGGGIDNQTLDPKKCVILSTATSNDHNFSTTQPYYGVIYMPNEDLTIDATTATIYGAVSARAISVTGNLNLRYDTSLRGADLGGVDRPWAVTEWRELSGSNNLATMP